MDHRRRVRIPNRHPARQPSEKDNILDPVPGITIYGITGAPVYYKFRDNVWQSLVLQAQAILSAMPAIVRLLCGGGG